MRRHNQEWSDPVFFSLSQASAGFQAGVKKSHVIMLLMTDTAVDNFVKGNMPIGGSGGFTIGKYGLNVSGAGGPTGGLELLMLSTSEGLSLGSGIATLVPKLNTKLNDQAYGTGTNRTRPGQLQRQIRPGHAAATRSETNGD